MGNNKITYTPIADVVIEKVGGAVKAAEITGAHRSIPYKWLKPKENGGTGGMIPVPQQAALLNSGLGITPEDFWRIEGDTDGTKEKD